MCGIFGIIGESDNQRKDFEILAIANRDRGKQSFGVFNGQEVFKYAGDPIDGIPDIPASMYGTRLICGHTRHATHGAKNKENCHPFTEGRITGAHNGVISNFYSLKQEYKQPFEVDSQMIFYLIDQKWRQGFSELRGSIAVWFYDNTRPEHFYLARNDDNPLHLIETERRVIFSSEWEPLKVLEPTGKPMIFAPSTLFRLHIRTLKFKTKKLPMAKPLPSNIASIGFDDDIDDGWYARYRQNGHFSPQATNWGTTKVGVEKHSPAPIILPQAQISGNKGWLEPEPREDVRAEMAEAGLFWCPIDGAFVEAGVETCKEHPEQDTETPHNCVYCGTTVPGAGEYMDAWRQQQQMGRLADFRPLID